MPLRLLVATALTLLLPAAPAAAAALAALEPCYVSAGRASDQREDVVVRGDGFTPMSAVEVLVDGEVVGSAVTGSVGEFGLTVDAPFQRRGERDFVVQARDAVSLVTLQSRVTNLAVFVRPRTAPPSRRVRFRGRGFMLDRPVYAHYLYGGREQRTVRLARRSNGLCGTFRARRRQIPVDAPRTGRWVVQIDQNEAYSRQPDPVLVRLPIDVREVFGAP
jgi:hypothetical protein